MFSFSFISFFIFGETNFGGKLTQKIITEPVIKNNHTNTVNFREVLYTFWLDYQGIKLSHVTHSPQPCFSVKSKYVKHELPSMLHTYKQNKTKTVLNEFCRSHFRPFVSTTKPEHNWEYNLWFHVTGVKLAWPRHVWSWPRVTCHFTLQADPATKRYVTHSYTRFKDLSVRWKVFWGSAVNRPRGNLARLASQVGSGMDETEVEADEGFIPRKTLKLV